MRNRFVLLAAIIAASGLSGCAQPTTGSSGNLQPPRLSENVELTAAGKAVKPVSITPVKIVFPDDRSYSAVPAAFKPKTCQLGSSHFTATAKVPGQINLPSYGAATPPMKVYCKSDQFEFDKTIKPLNLTQQAIAVASAAHLLVGYGLVGAAVTASQGSQRDKSKDLYGYPLKIELQ